jgi:hypothetical protein
MARLCGIITFPRFSCETIRQVCCWHRFAWHTIDLFIDNAIAIALLRQSTFRSCRNTSSQVANEIRLVLIMIVIRY